MVVTTNVGFVMLYDRVPQPYTPNLYPARTPKPPWTVVTVRREARGSRTEDVERLQNQVRPRVQDL